MDVFLFYLQLNSLNLFLNRLRGKPIGFSVLGIFVIEKKHDIDGMQMSTCRQLNFLIQCVFRISSA